MTARVRFAGLLAVLLVVGAAGVASAGSRGTPLLLGKANRVKATTSLDNPSTNDAFTIRAAGDGLTVNSTHADGWAIKGTTVTPSR